MNVLFHGSPRELVGKYLLPSQAYDSPERPENNLLAVYASDRRDLAIVMAMIGCPSVIGGSIDEYIDGNLNARLYGGYPSEEFIFLYHLPVNSFTQTKIDLHQFVSMVPIKPLKTEKILLSEYFHLVRLATPKETAVWKEKYL